ncbi:protein arginine N-methyltransferase 5 [Agrilus planipennis]|uniref:Protein arginine N-methyltransferase n=1 Tax=Agrilus planipennis TaxID=224129 RepID=A0A7F5QWU6_AGRPL|nr:protein arginine N-methyltransferase 5 [Agrilus planipennis]
MEQVEIPDQEPSQEKRKRMSSALEIDCPGDLRECLRNASNDGYHFIIINAVHPRYSRDLLSKNAPHVISRTDRILTGTDWNRLIVGKLTSINVDSETNHVRNYSKAILNQELGFASHLGLPAVIIRLHQRNNTNLAGILMEKLAGSNVNFQVWIQLPMIHPTCFSPICSKSEEEDVWEWWNDLRTLCHYDKRLGLMLELPDSQHIPSELEIKRWMGEPVKVLQIKTSLFLTNHYNQPVLSRNHQEIISKMLNLDVQYVIKGPKLHGKTYKPYCAYINYLGKKLFKNDAVTEFVQGCEDFLQNPLQPLTENLETLVYEVFEKDQVKYVEYQRAIQKALEDLPLSIIIPVIMVVGAGRGPLVQACLNASYILQRKVKIYAVEKNPYAINTLEDRVQNEWHGQVILVKDDMRRYKPPEEADILVSELLGSFGDNELSPECLDGAQRFLKKTGISIPVSYTSYLAPLQSSKIYNEIKNSKTADKTTESLYETPYIIHLVNYYQIAVSQPLFKFEHPNWNEVIDNDRYGKLRFPVLQNCVLTGFAGYFETVLYKDVILSINPQTYSVGMVSWFPIVFPLPEPVQVSKGETIEVAFWRSQNEEKVWYQWCLLSPHKGSIINPNGRSYFIKKH